LSLRKSFRALLWRLVVATALLALSGSAAAVGSAHAQGNDPVPTVPPPAVLPELGQFVSRCGTGSHQRTPDFAASGYLLTTFSRDAMWVVDLDRNTRYPLPNTQPCGPNCRPSPDRRTLLYVSPETATFWTMDPTGVQRNSIFPYYVAELDWWDADHWVFWSAAGLPAIQPIAGGDPVYLPDYDVFSLRPGGYAGLRLMPSGGEWPVLELVDMNTGIAHPLLEKQPYLGAAYWSPDGSHLAYIGAGEIDATLNLRGAELFLLTPGEATAYRVTDLTAAYGAVRITGELDQHALSWSPDGRHIAFWVIEILGPDIAVNVGHAVLHVLNIETGQTVVYCGLGTNHTGPHMPRLVWSPEGRYIAFGLDEPGDERPAILYVLNTESGNYTEVTEGMYAAFGTYDPVMWARR
jgi:hypothetical protein